MKGFTLLEMLIVVLIVALLASAASLEYRKVVEKSHAAQALNTLRALYKAELSFQMSHGKFANRFQSLSLSFPGNKINCSQNNSSPCWGYYNTEAIQDKDWSVEIEGGKNPSISIGRIAGPYAGAGFFIQLARKDGIQYPLEQIACVENRTGSFKFKKKEGAYCIDIMDGEYYNQSGVSRKYTLPL